MKQSWYCIYIPSLVYHSIIDYSSKTLKNDNSSFQNLQSYLIQQFSSFLLDSLLYIFQSKHLHEELYQSVFFASFPLLFDCCKQNHINIGINLSSLFSYSTLSSYQLSLLLLFLIKIYTKQQVLSDLPSFTVFSFPANLSLVNPTFHYSLVKAIL